MQNFSKYTSWQRYQKPNIPRESSEFYYYSERKRVGNA